MASLKNQVASALKTSKAIGQSKKDRKQELGKKGFGNGTDKIHSLKYFQSVQETSMAFVEHVKTNYNVKDIAEFTQEHKDSFMAQLESKGSGKSYMSLVESHLKHLERAVNNFNQQIRHKEVTVSLVPERTIQHSEKEKPGNRSFHSREQAEQVISKMSKSTQSAAVISLNLGFRVKEAINIRVEHVQQINGKTVVKIENGAGITKGGRPRMVPVPERFESELQRMIAGKSPSETIVSNNGKRLVANTVEKALNRSCKALGELETGIHRFRHTYARERLNGLLENIPNGRTVMDKIIKNKAAGKRMNTGIPRVENATYKEVKKVIDIVHAELGHNGNRWELVAVYMS